MKRQLWYNSWTEEYMEGLPIGNGRLAAMVLGSPERCRIAINHEWLWRGVHRNRTHPDVSMHLPEIREALLSGDFLKGTELANEYLGGKGGISGEKNRVDPYQPALDLFIELDTGGITDYRRELDLDSALAEVSFCAEGARIRERVFASASDGCIVATLECSKPCDGRIVISRIPDPVCEITQLCDSDRLILCGSFAGGISFASECRAFSDGSLTYAPGSLEFRSAEVLTLLINVGTGAKGGDPMDELLFPDTDCAEELLRRHRQAFSALIGQARVDIDVTERDDLPTDERIRLFKDGKEPSMPLLYFEYGRYLMASGSSGELPLNLQGKWNEELEPPWRSDYHLDINLEMCYWFAETLGMHKALDTLFNLIESYVPYGRVMAKNLYGCGGFTLCLQTDVWGRVTPESKGWAVWTGAAPWLGSHMFKHWRYTKSFDFLKNRCYPYLKECAEFYEDYLIEIDGKYCIVPSQSPENRFEGTGSWPVSIGFNSAMDIELITELLTNAIECSELLGIDEDKRKTWGNILSRMPKVSIDSQGRLNEWDSERVEVEPGHRHLSHLYGVYPANLFARGSDEWKAAERSLDSRLSHGGGPSGWSRSWVACLMARFGRSEDAWEHFTRLIGDFATISLLDLHPPRIFQIDGNMGGTACVCEMLMQSQRGVLRLLPALPSAWQSGRVEHFLAEDGVDVSFAWRNSRLCECTLIASEDTTLRIISEGIDRTVTLTAGSIYSLFDN